MMLKTTQPVVLGCGASAEYFPVGTEVELYRGCDLHDVVDSGEARALRECCRRMKQGGAIVAYCRIGDHVCCLEQGVFDAGEVSAEVGVSQVSGRALVSGSAVPAA